MEKKFFSTLLICLALLTSCGNSGGSGDTPPVSDVPVSPVHTHAPFSEWVCDFDNHWHECECGEQLDSAPHTLDGVNCTVCGSEAVEWADGSKQITVYNSHGDCSQFIFYDADGSVRSEEKFDFTYDEAGNMSSLEAYFDGFHYAGYEYAVGADGSVHIASKASYLEDGTYSVSTYDEGFRVLRTVYFAADHAIECEYRYTYSDDYSRMTEQKYCAGNLIFEREYILSEDSPSILLYECIYHEDGTKTMHEYDMDGNLITFEE